MPETVEEPAETLQGVAEDHSLLMPDSVRTAIETVRRKPPRINQQNARELALKSHESRRRAKAAAEAERLALLNPPATASQPAASGNEELSLVEEQISRMRDQLRSDMEPGERAQLVRALDLMLDRKRILQERPLPGSRRPAPELRQSRGSSLLRPPAVPTAPNSQEGQAG